MNPPETASAPAPSLARDWLDALRYWVRGPKGIAVLIASALAVGAALNWSWLVAVGVAPLLLTLLPCAVMCGLGLCLNKMTGSSCSTSPGSADHSSASMPDAVQRIAASEPDQRASVPTTVTASALADLSSNGAVEPEPDRQPQVLKERE